MTKTKNNKSNVVTINTKCWTRNEFCNQYGHMCALGFAGKQINGDPFDTPSELCKRFNDIAEVNDNVYGPNRRKELRRLFKEAGYRLLFK